MKSLILVPILLLTFSCGGDDEATTAASSAGCSEPYFGAGVALTDPPLVASVAVGGALITVTYGNDAHAVIKTNTVTLIATDHLGSIGWVCAGVGIADKHLPPACR